MTKSSPSCETSTSLGNDDRPSTAKSGRERTHHTITACVRCRQRKTRCDPGLPRCDPCARAKVHCEYFDVAKNYVIPRTYITYLQAKIKKLKEELLACQHEEKDAPDAESMARTAGMIKFNDKDDYRFLGPSSGIAITRLVMEFAKQNTANKKIRDIVPAITAREIKKKFDDECGKPTSKVYPLISSVAAPHLPTQELMDKLIEIYMAKAQYMLPLLHEPTFRQQAVAVYQGSSDATLNFQLRLVIAISMQKLSTQYAGLADSYYLAALPFLEAAVEKRDLSTLQCLALIAQYSTLTPTRTASYWVVGLATRLSHELQITEEMTISEWPPGTSLNPLDIDMRRRMYWIVSSLEYGLSHSLGRPSAFATTIDHVNVDFFQTCDDRYITSRGLFPERQLALKKCIAIHFFRMRLLQAEIRRTLYLNKWDQPNHSQDFWFHRMELRIDEWLRTCPKNDEGSGYNEDWFLTKRNTMIVFLYRPTPQVPEPSDEAAAKCFDASAENVEIQSLQITQGSVDLTWIFTQILLMALNTILWSMSYASIRQRHPMREVVPLLERALESIKHTSERWPGVQSALQLYENLIRGCLRACVPEPSRSFEPPQLNRHTSSPLSRQNTHAPASPAYTNIAELRRYQSDSGYPRQNEQESQFGFPSASLSSDYIQDSLPHQGHQPQIYPSPPPSERTLQPSPIALQRFHSDCSAQTVLSYDDLPPDPQVVDSSSPAFEPLLPHFDPKAAFGSLNSNATGFEEGELDPKAWLGWFGDEYSRYKGQAYQGPGQRMPSLSEEQQLELMATLEQDELPDVTDLANDVAVSYMGSGS